MSWTLSEAISYYASLGAPRDQSVLISLLREVQQEQGGIPAWALARISSAYDLKPSLLPALIRRIPSLRMADTHLLEVCCGPNCSRRCDLMGEAEKIGSAYPVTVRAAGCMRMCGKGPNIRFDGTVYHQATPELIRQLLSAVSPDLADKGE